MINLEEIIVVNVTGVVLLLLLPYVKIAGNKKTIFGDRIFTIMRWMSIFALTAEIISFLIDGYPGKVNNILSYVFNGYLFFASASVGMLWILYIDFSIYQNIKRIRKFMSIISLPLLIVVALIVGDMFGFGNIFSISAENVYIRGNLVWVSYVTVFVYYAYSIVLSLYATHKNGIAPFDAHYFVIPCIVGTLVQGMHYGITFGWFGVSIAFILIQMRRQNFNAYIDSLSRLYNRGYYDYFLDKIVRSKRCKNLSGIMMDINAFKSINDCFGHKVGDDAICELSNILMNVCTKNSTIFRLAGDEFVIISKNQSDYETKNLICDLQTKIESFNNQSKKPYKLSVAVGYCICDVADFDSDKFFNKMDKKMYESKADYYEQSKISKV